MDLREKLIELIGQEVVPYFSERIADILIANGVTIPVRCCQCKHSDMCEDGTVFCRFYSEFSDRKERRGVYSMWMEPDDFCSYGERRTNETL